MKTEHDGDCWIYAVNGVCTCGLLHRIVRNPESEEYDSKLEEIEKHEIGLHYLNNTTIPEPSAKDIESANKLLRDMGFDIE